MVYNTIKKEELDCDIDLSKSIRTLKNYPTDIQLASYYKTTTRTLRNWKKDEVLNRRYLALKQYYIDNVKGK